MMKHILLNCCCSAPPAATIKAPPDDEGALDVGGAVYKLQFVNDEGKVNPVSLSGCGAGQHAHDPSAAGPAAAPSPAVQRCDKDTALSRLQELIREFAREAVGPGVHVEVKPSGAAPVEHLLRMDRGLRCIELWPPEVSDDCKVDEQIPLQQVESVSKGVDPTAPPTPRDDCVLTVRRRNEASDVVLVFDTNAMREKAHTCLRIFQMSVDQSSGASREGSRQTGSRENSRSADER